MWRPKTSKWTWFLNFWYLISLYRKKSPIKKRLLHSCVHKSVIAFMFLSMPFFLSPRWSFLSRLCSFLFHDSHIVLIFLLHCALLSCDCQHWHQIRLCAYCYLVPILLSKLVVAIVSQLHIALCQLQSLCNLLNFSSTLRHSTFWQFVLQLHFSTFGVLLLICILHCCKYTHFISFGFFFCLQCFFLIIFFAKVTMNRIEKKGRGEDATQSREERMQQRKEESRRCKRWGEVREIILGNRWRELWGTNGGT